MWLEGGGEEDKVMVLKEGKPLHLSVCLLALGLCSMEGWMDGLIDKQRRTGNTSPPLLLTLSSSALWSWMELNANDLTD